MKLSWDCFTDAWGVGGKRVKTQSSHFAIFEPNLSLQGAKSQMKKQHLASQSKTQIP